MGERQFLPEKSGYYYEKEWEAILVRKNQLTSTTLPLWSLSFRICTMETMIPL